MSASAMRLQAATDHEFDARQTLMGLDHPATSTSRPAYGLIDRCGQGFADLP
jgi:hypothetical protein